MHPIAEEFQRHAVLVTNADFGYELNDIQKPVFRAATEVYCRYVEKLIEEKPRFFSDFDYGWAARPENYSLPLEAQLQFMTLLILSEIAPDHDDYKWLGNICVRALASRHVNMEAVVRGEYKYIVVSISFIRVMQNWGVVVRGLLREGRTVTDASGVLCAQNYCFGRDMEKAVRHRWSEVTPYIDYLIDTCAVYRAGLVPERSFALAEDSDSAAHATIFIMVGEMFFVCHEIVHLLKHRTVQVARSDENEIEADHFAASLFIIFQSAYSVWCSEHGSEELAKHPVIASAHSTGPAIFFSVMHTLLVIERLVLASRDGPESQAMLDMANSEFARIGARMAAYRKTVSRFLAHIELMAKIIPATPTYGGALQQLDVIGVAARMRLVERLKLPVEISLDKNLFRGFPDS